MKLSRIFGVKGQEELDPIIKQCSQFFKESAGLPLLKNLPNEYADIRRVKVRKRKTQGKFAETFNEAFDEEFYELRQRAVFANGIASLSEAETNEDPFFIFPINGYKFLYSSEVENSNQQYKSVFEAIVAELDDDTAEETLKDLLKFTYTSSNLHEGIDSGAEIILYNIPYYYAIRAGAVDSYEELLSYLQ